MAKQTADDDGGPQPALPGIQPRLVVLVGVLLYWAALFVATHMPGDDRVNPQDYIPHLDKFVHAAAFAGLAALMLLGASGWWRPGPRMYLAVICILAVYAGLDEFTQGFVPLRQSDARDWLADMLGALAGVGLFAALWHWLVKRAAARD